MFSVGRRNKIMSEGMRFDSVAQKDRLSVDIGDVKTRIESCRTDAAWRELTLTGKVRTLIIEKLEDLEAGGPVELSADDVETLRLLIGFLNYLIDHFDHDGYSLSEISKILGRPDDKGLVNLVQKLQNGQAQPKPGAKVK
jgi:hypothetical protein